MIPPITVHSRLTLKRKTGRLDGRRVRVKLGNWAIYLPTMRLKILRAHAGNVHCVHATAPQAGRRPAVQNADRELQGGNKPASDPGFSEDWDKALSKPVEIRAAENWIAAKRLAAAGLGPEPGCLVLVREMFAAGAPDKRSWTCGYEIENAKWLPPIDPPNEEDMRRAGVEPDRSRSCLRETISGYVTDLNSVVGVMPIDAQDEIDEIARALRDARDNMPKDDIRPARPWHRLFMR